MKRKATETSVPYADDTFITSAQKNMAAHTPPAKEIPAEPTEHTSQSHPALDVSEHDAADRLVRNHVWGAMGVGLIPFPITDIVGLAAIQLNLLRKLAQLYHVPFRKGAARNILSSLVLSTLPVAVTPAIAFSIVKAVPIFGQTAGVLTLPILGGASTYALGKVFIQHFASGGTFLIFDPEQVKDYYQRMFDEGKIIAEGKTVAADMSSDTPS